MSAYSSNSPLEHQLLGDLNAAQKEAVMSDAQYLLILAGAGSGKTRVLVHRIAWLCLKLRYDSRSIFAVTFTNKAAHEMSERIKKQMGASHANNMWIGTFHGLAHRLLRVFYQSAGLPMSFQLIDGEDQLRLVKSVIKNLHLDEKKVAHRACAHFISDQKEKGIRPPQVEVSDPTTKLYLKVYVEYQAICERLGYVDFSELLLRAYEALQKDEAMRRYCQGRFTNLLVDEFQDTNAIQYQFIQLLAGKTGNILIVGDDDQAIYSWRGATADNLQRFKEDYPEAELVRLEQNYRSAPQILQAANSLIAHNQQRLGKKLWTQSENPQKIELYQAFNALEEARMVIDGIKKAHDLGIAYEECAILYRNNFQSSLFESALLQNHIPYKIYGAVRFYERLEIKQALSYLRLIYYPSNDLAFEYIINCPARGIGEMTLTKLRLFAAQQHCSLWESAVSALSSAQFTSRQKSSLARFIELIEAIYAEIKHLPLPQQLEIVIEASGIRAMYEAEESLKSESRLDHLEQLIVNAAQFVTVLEAESMPQTDPKNARKTGDKLDQALEEALKNRSILERFLSDTALDAQFNYDENGVQLMTIHGSKGLEFDAVFMVGLEDGLFPSERALADGDRLEEERRLAYVGITRARARLSLFFCETRRIYNEDRRHLPSRFLQEIDKHVFSSNLVESLFSKPALSKSVFSAAPSNAHEAPEFLQKQKAHFKTQQNQPYVLGTKVIHGRFGEGTIISTEGEGDHLRLQIAFANNGIKWLVAKMTDLKIKN